MRTRLAGALLLVLAAGSAAAKYTLSPGYPWTVSDTGTETAEAIGLDYHGWICIAGNVTTPGTGRDILLHIYSLTLTGAPIATLFFDSGYGYDEGPPAMKVLTRPGPWYGAPSETEFFLTFTSPTPGVPVIGLLYLKNYFTKTGTLYQEAGGAALTAAPALDVTSSGTPYVTGALTLGGLPGLGGVDHLFVSRVPYTTIPTPPFDQDHRITATYWTGSLSTSITGRAVAVDGTGASWVVGQSAGDLWLLRYTPDAYPDPDLQHMRALIDPAYPKHWATPGTDEPRAAAIDGLGYLWVAGAIDNDGAVWRFTPGGDPVPGFPVRINAGAPTTFAAIALTGDRRALVTGLAGNLMILAGVDEAGGLVPGLPVTHRPPGAASARGAGIALDPDGSAWIAGTLTGGAISAIGLWHYGFEPDPPPLSPGEVVVRGPEGGLLNLARGEVVTIAALPRVAGDLRAQVLTPRGELVREFTAPSRGNELVAITWDGRNAAGEFVASGMYAVRVTGGGLSVVRRVVVLRKK